MEEKITPKFAKQGGLVPAIVQDHMSGQVLMLAYMNEEAWNMTLETREAHYFSRSRQTLWHKGDTSGHVQRVKEILLDCDADTVLLKVEQVGGAACHEGYASCFFRRRRGTAGRRWGRRFLIPGRYTSVDKLRLGIPKGSLEKATIDLFRRAGWNIKGNGRSYFPDIDDPEIACTMCRAQEMSRYVENGTLDCGLTGKDWIIENDSRVVVVADLMYSKASSRPVRWVLAVPGDSEIRSIADMAGKKIATELVNYTHRYFQSKKIPVTVEFSWGATEAKVAQGLADAVVEVTETGSTIRAHGLKIIHEFFQSNTQLIVNPEVWENNDFKREKIENLRVLLMGALRAENMVGLKMNIQEKSLKSIIALLPSLLAPTISSLYETDWYSVEVVVNQEEVRSLVPRLVAAGAQGIVEYPLYKVI